MLDEKEFEELSVFLEDIEENDQKAILKRLKYISLKDIEKLFSSNMFFARKIHMYCLLCNTKKIVKKYMNYVLGRINYGNQQEINDKDNYSNTAIMYSIFHKNKEITLELLRLGADVTIKNNQYESALDISRENGKFLLNELRNSMDIHYCC